MTITNFTEQFPMTRLTQSLRMVGQSIRTLIVTALLGSTMIWGVTIAQEAPAAADATAQAQTATSESATAPTSPAAPTSSVVPFEALNSPQATMVTFLEGMNILNDGRVTGLDRYEAEQKVQACFNFPEAEYEPGLAIAAQTYGVLNRLGTIEPQDLPDAAMAAELKLRRFVFFPHIPTHAWVREKLDKYPPGQIVLTRQEDGRWLFSRQTVLDMPELYAAMEELEDRHSAQSQVTDLLGPTFTDTTWMGWVWLLLAIFVGLAVGKTVQGVANSISKRAELRQQPLRAAIFADAAGPLSLLMLTIGIHLGLGGLVMSEGLQDFTFRVVAFFYILVLGWFAYNLVDVIDHWLTSITSKSDTKIDDMVVPLIRKALRIFLIIVFTLVVAQNVFGLNILSFLAGLGLAGLAISLAAQDSVKNLFGSMTVFFDKPFLMGDFITFDGYTGTVEDIGFRSTRIRLLSGHLVTVPNMKFIDNNVENISARPYIRREMNITITYDTPTEKIQEAIEIVKALLTDGEVVESGRFNMEDFPPRVAFNELNADSLNIKAYYWYQLAGDKDRTFFTYLDHAQLVNLKLFNAFAAAGIDFAFPTQTIYLANDDKRQLAVRILESPSQGGADHGR